jgi:hypothetical protein
MNRKLVIIVIIGIILVSLGFLWFLQGSDIVHLQPILCFADCEPITGKSPLWQVIGVTTFVVGIILVGKSIKRKTDTL